MSESHSSPPKLLVVEDDATLRNVLGRELRERGYDVLLAGDFGSAQGLVEACDLVLLDERIPGGRGLDLLRRWRREGRMQPVVFLTGHGDVALAVAAIQAGAFHFLTKPCDLGELVAVLERARSGTTTRAGARGDGPTRYVGRSEVVSRLRELVARAAQVETPVLIRGESGTGKELIARRIHDLGPRKSKPWVAMNAASLPDTLAEAELFGHEKGAFSGADHPRSGLVAAAQGGTLFLDEVGDLSLAIQAKLLRFLETGAYRRLGSTDEKRADVRIVAATNVDLDAAIASSRFRRDLYFRLHVLELRLPPLRERFEDLPELIAHACERRNRPMPSEITEVGFLRRLESYSWPGNVRELYNVLERAWILSEDGTFDPAIVDEYLRMAGGTLTRECIDGPDRLAEVEMEHIRRVLDRCGGNKTKAAEMLGIGVKTLYNKLRASRS